MWREGYLDFLDLLLDGGGVAHLLVGLVGHAHQGAAHVHRQTETSLPNIQLIHSRYKALLSLLYLML